MNILPMVSGYSGSRELKCRKTYENLIILTSATGISISLTAYSPRTVVLPDSTSSRYVILHYHPDKTHQVVLETFKPARTELTLVKTADPGIMQVQDRTTRLDQLSLLCRTSRETILLKLFVLMDEMLDLSFLRGQRVELVDVELSQLLDVDRSSVPILTVVELGIVFVHFALFGIVETVTEYRPSGLRSEEKSAVWEQGESIEDGKSLLSACIGWLNFCDYEKYSRSDLIRAKLLSPLFICFPHHLSPRQVKLASSKKTEQGSVIISIVPDLTSMCFSVGWYQTGRDEVGAELGECGLLGIIPVKCTRTRSG